MHVVMSDVVCASIPQRMDVTLPPLQKYDDVGPNQGVYITNLGSGGPW